MCWSVSIMEQPFFAPHKSGVFLLTTSLNLFIILFLCHLAKWQKFIVNYALKIKKHSQHHFHIGLNLPCVFGSRWCFWDPMKILGFCFDNIAIYPSFITCADILYKDFTAFARSICSLLTSTQVCFWSFFSRHSTNLIATQCMPKFFRENPMTLGFWYSNFLCYFTNGQMTVGTIHFPNFWDVFFIFWCWTVSWTFTVNWSSALFKMFVSLMGVCSTHGFIPNACFNILKASKTVFPNLRQNFTQTLAHEKSPRLNW